MVFRELDWFLESTTWGLIGLNWVWGTDLKGSGLQGEPTSGVTDGLKHEVFGLAGNLHEG